jgi:radical SAM superfamily enzyme YgiQ (UPF0313 family)
MREITTIKKYFPKTRIGFADDNIFVSRNFSKTLLSRLKDLKIRYMGQSDISVAEDEELLDLLRRSGCNYLIIGFESLNRDNLDHINKNRWKSKYLDKYAAYIERIQSHGIGVLGAFIVGFDHDTLDSINNVSEFIIQNHLYGAQITVLTPLPGSRLREKMEKQNRILHSDWEKYTYLDVVFKPKKMTADELQDGLLGIYQQCFSRDVHLKKMKHLKDIFKSFA